MVVGKVKRREHVPIVLHFRTFGNGEAQAREDVDDFFADERYRVACANFLRSSSACKVDVDVFHCTVLKCLLEGINFVGGKSLELVELLTDFTFLFVWYIPEVAEERSDFAFFA